MQKDSPGMACSATGKQLFSLPGLFLQVEYPRENLRVPLRGKALLRLLFYLRVLFKIYLPRFFVYPGKTRGFLNARKARGEIFLTVRLLSISRTRPLSGV